MKCDLCDQQIRDGSEIKFLPLYINGSKGIYICSDCGMILTDVARGIRLVSTRSYLSGQRGQYLKMKTEKEKKEIIGNGTIQ